MENREEVASQVVEVREPPGEPRLEVTHGVVAILVTDNERRHRVEEQRRAGDEDVPGLAISRERRTGEGTN